MQPQSQAAGLRADAVALAELVAPQDSFIGQVVRGGRATLVAAGTSNPDLASAEKQFPGLLDALWKALEPKFRASGEELLPKHRARLASVYQAKLTPTEISAVQVFYSSATGRKLVRGIYTADLKPMINEVVASPDQDLSAESLVRAERTIIGNAVQSMNKDDAPVLAQLARTVGEAKMRQLGAEVQKVGLELINKPDPVFEARITRLAEAVTEDFVTKASAKQ